MNDEKLKRFANDIRMQEAVHGILLDSFLKPQKQTDTQFLAASRVAIDLLQDAWKELMKYKNKSDDEKEERTQIGL